MEGLDFWLSGSGLRDAGSGFCEEWYPKDPRGTQEIREFPGMTYGGVYEGSLGSTC